MTREEAVIRDIIGPERVDIRPLAGAVAEMEHTLFTRRIAMDDVLVTKHIYPEVAKRMELGPSSAARRIERLANRCWDRLDGEQMQKYIGRLLRNRGTPCDLIVYLAYYCCSGKPFYEAVFEEPALLF